MSKTLAEMLTGGKVRLKTHGAVFELTLAAGVTPAEFLAATKADDPAAEFDTQLIRSNSFGGKGGFPTKRAVVAMITLSKVGADVMAQTAEGEDVLVKVWKDKAAELLGALPLTDDQKAKIPQVADGTLKTNALINLTGKHVEVEYSTREKDGQTTHSATAFHVGAKP